MSVMVLYHMNILIPNISSDITRVTQRTSPSLQNDKRPQSGSVDTASVISLAHFALSHISK